MVDADFKEPDEGAASSAKGGLVKILIYALVVIAIGVGGFFAGKMLSGGGSAKDDTVQKGEVKPGPGESGSKTGSEQTGNNTAVDSGTKTETGNDAKTGDKGNQGFLSLETFTVNLNDPFGRRYVECVLNLVLDDKSLVPRIKENELAMAKIRHEIFMTISAKSYNDLKSTAGKITLFEEIQMRVNEIMKEQMGVEPVIEVLQTKFLMQ